jgi:hypothetical protein
MMQAIESGRERIEIDLLNEESLAGTAEEFTRRPRRED